MTVVDEHVTEMQVAVADRARARAAAATAPRRATACTRGGCAPEPFECSELLDDHRHAQLHVRALRPVLRQAPAERVHHLDAVQRPEKAAPARRQALARGRRRVAELDSRQEPRAEERPRERLRTERRCAPAPGSGSGSSGASAGSTSISASKPGSTPRAAETGTPTRRRRRRPCCPSPRRAGAPAAQRARETAPRRAAAPALNPRRSRDPTAARDADYVSRLQAWLAAEIPRGS